MLPSPDLFLPNHLLANTHLVPGFILSKFLSDRSIACTNPFLVKFLPNPSLPTIHLVSGLFLNISLPGYLPPTIVRAQTPTQSPIFCFRTWYYASEKSYFRNNLVLNRPLVNPHSLLPITSLGLCFHTSNSLIACSIKTYLSTIYHCYQFHQHKHSIFLKVSFWVDATPYNLIIQEKYLDQNLSDKLTMVSSRSLLGRKHRSSRLLGRTQKYSCSQSPKTKLKNCVCDSSDCWRIENKLPQTEIRFLYGNR